jgi:23S rRNA pseudoU1915 N3-methylase RlmH
MRTGRSSPKNADLHLAFGALTWRHQLVRVLLLEQI